MGADDRHRRHARGGRVRGAGAVAVPPQAHPGAAAVRRSEGRHRRRAPTSSATCAGRPCSTTSSSPRPTSPPGRRGPAAGEVARPLGRARPGRPQGGGRRAGRAGHHPAQPAPRSSATRWASRARRSAGGSPSRAAGGPPTCSTRRAPRRSSAITKPRGLRRRAAALPGRGAGLARLPRRRRARRLPGPRHGPRQDPHRARPPRPHRRRAARPRDRPAGRGRQLGGRGGPLRPALRSSCTTAQSGRRPTSWSPRWRAPTS